MLTCNPTLVMLSSKQDKLREATSRFWQHVATPLPFIRSLIARPPDGIVERPVHVKTAGRLSVGSSLTGLIIAL